MNKDKKTYEEVKKVLAAEWGVAPQAIPDDAALNRFKPWDSVGHIAVMLALSAAFEFDLNPDHVQRLSSLSRIVEYLTPRTVVAMEERPNE